ncbi:MAG TPA: DUF4294 domain-containing protein [Saprospiraceae bacterium]|nr:DUF4294 domain-containing protein [Saprospiraceae bacterium]HMQ81613.1 DUF4294 domain-containing protein [Saprospiraceae bacterium]
MNTKRHLLLMLLFLALGFTSFAQNGTIIVDGQKYPYTVDDCGDTLILATLDDISISTMREFENREDYLRYRKYRAYAVKVYPYAVEAIKIFRELEYATENMKEKERKKYVKKLHKDLKEEFTDPLKNLSKTQGKILIKMIERELDKPMFDLIKELRNGMTASYWNTLGSFYGHKLKDGYVEGEDPILDAVLQDMDVSYQVKQN